MCCERAPIKGEDAPHRSGRHVAGRSQHDVQYPFHQPTVGSWQKEVVGDELAAWLLVACLDRPRHRLEARAELRRKHERCRIDHDDSCDAAGVCSSELQDRYASHSVTDRDNPAETQLVDDVCDIVRVGRNRVIPLGLITFAVSA